MVKKRQTLKKRSHRGGMKSYPTDPSKLTYDQGVAAADLERRRPWLQRETELPPPTSPGQEEYARGFNETINQTGPPLFLDTSTPEQAAPLVFIPDEEVQAPPTKPAPGSLPTPTTKAPGSGGTKKRRSSRKVRKSRKHARK